MNKPFITLAVCLTAAISSLAQTAANTPAAQPYGKVDIADLEMKACDFEKDANAMVLFDKGDVYYDYDFNLVMERHKRIKIFNDNGKNEANIRIEYISGGRLEYITDIQAETININNGKAEITKLDKKSIYTQMIDKSTSAYVFSFPNIKPGSIIEYKYKWATNYLPNFPSWRFQSNIPTRYSELDTAIPDVLYFKQQGRINTPFAIDKSSSDSRSIGSYSYNLEKRQRALVNVPSLNSEPYMRSMVDNLQSLTFQLTYVKPFDGFVKSYSDTWAKLGGIIADDEDFGSQLNKKLANEDAIINKAKSLNTNNAKIAYIFKEVQSGMKWNGMDRWYTNDGTKKAWETKTGNSAEVNLIVYHLLKASGVDAYPMIVSTRDHGRVNPSFSFLYQFNRAVVYVPVDSVQYYILDATDKYNSYNVIPDNLLNSTGFYIDKENKTYNTRFISRPKPAQDVIMVKADINPDGKMAGKVVFSCDSYTRINNIKKYKTDGEEKYIDYLKNNNNGLKISAMKFENMDVDTLPLNENIDFKLDLTGSDNNYIYFKPSVFNPMRTNPFLNEKRMTDIDFGYKDDFSLIGSYKIPAGYKTEALPKSITMQMPDKSMTFRRLIAEENGTIMVRYIMDFKKTIYFKENYPQIYDFYKRLHELLDEQIVLKKS